MRQYSIGLCTPIPMVPVDAVAIGTEKVKQAIAQLSGESVNTTEARKLLEEAIAPASTEKHLGLVTPEWQRARKNLCCPPGHNWIEIFADGMEVGVARNAAVNTARQAGLKYIFFNDWDVILPMDSLIKLSYFMDNNPDYAVATGMYVMKSIPPFPLIWTEWNSGVHFDFTMGDVIKEGVVGTPMGCTLLRLSAFDDLPYTDEKPWFKTIDDTIKVGDTWYATMMTEDLFFTKRLTDETKWKIMVDTGIWCDHIDHATGKRYTLGDDSLPVRRAKERAAVAA